jgi:hypothetical protein
MTVKANMPTLCRQLKKLPWAAVPAFSAVTTDHGRRARRTVKVALAPAWIEFEGAAQVAQLRRTVTKDGKKTVEVAYLITSDRDADPAPLGPQALGDRKPSSLGQGRDLPGGQIAGQDRKRTPRDGLAAQPGHQPAPPGRPGRNHQSFGISGKGSGRIGAAAGMLNRLRLRGLQEAEVAGQLPLGRTRQLAAL